MIGRYNVSNVLGLSIVHAMGMDVVNAVQKLNKFRGRGEWKRLIKDNPRVVVDYAHTPDALRTLWKCSKSAPRAKFGWSLGAAETGIRERDWK